MSKIDEQLEELGFKKVLENKYGFTYEKETKHGYVQVIEMHTKTRCLLTVSSFEKRLNKDGFNNSVGLSLAELEVVNKKIKEWKRKYRYSYKEHKERLKQLQKYGWA